VRTAWYASMARSVLAWSGVSQTHGLHESLHVIDVDRRCVRPLPMASADQARRPLPDPRAAELPAPRGGALHFPLGAHEAMMMCGSDHDDGEDMREPWLCELVLP
jgi:hypothetical protein